MMLFLIKQKQNKFGLKKMKKKALISGILVSIGLLTSFLCINNTEPSQVSYARITVTVNGGGRVEGLTDSLIPIGTVLTLTAVENEGYLFGGWGIDSVKFRNPLVLTIKSDTRFTALFVKKPSSLIRVVAKGKSFSMGSDNPDDPDEERPSKLVYFDYDFYAASSEVTIGEYRQLFPEFTKLSGDSFPVGSISWYDAILYCNALSKRDGYDTVYSYSAICRDLGCTFFLEDWKIHYDRVGYRLPTEAEWEFISRAGTTGDYWWGSGEPDSCAWYFSNSNMKRQPVKTRKPNPWGFYDLNGNVAEWVNDWLGYFTTAVDTNPVGPVDKTQQEFETSFQRPVRGGSYRLGISYLRSSSRKGSYDVEAFFAQQDVGFRVALGAFNAKKHSEPQVPVSIIDSSKVIVTKTDLLRFIGTSSIKIAYVQSEKLKRYLFIADFTGDGISVTQCGRDSNVFCPTISPDGHYVAYSSTGEGTAGGTLKPCSLTVRSVSSGFNDTSLLRMPGTIPRWWISPGVKDTFLIYTTGTSKNDEFSWHNEKTMRIKMQAGRAFGSPEVVWANGSYHGGMSADGRFIATGYTATRLVDMQVKDTNIFYFWPPYSGRDDTTQTCNVSMSPSVSEPGEVMLLDFGYPKVSTVTGRSYGLHSVIFVCNTNMLNSKHVSKWFEVPSGYSQWDYPEWSNHPDFAVSFAKALSGPDMIYAIDCSNKNYQQLVSGTKFREVYLWIDPWKLAQKNDPYRFFGRYDLPVQSGGQIMLSKKLHLFWKYRDEWECAMLGSSTAYYGFDPSKMSLKSINLGCFASNIMTADALAEKYCFTQLKKLKAIVVDLMSYSFNTDSYKDPPRLTGLLDSKGFELDSSEHFYKDGIPSEIDSTIKTWGPKDWSEFDSLGFHSKVQATGWGEPIIDKGDYSIDDSVVQTSLAIVKLLAEIAAHDSIHVLIVNTPQHPGYATSENMGRLGPGVKTYRKLETILQAIESQNNYFHYYDANNFGNHDYTAEDAYDANHLSPKGAAKLTLRIDSLVNSYLTH
jgi:formylglycine-generating enzyme required for sulfatase activity